MTPTKSADSTRIPNWLLGLFGVALLALIGWYFAEYVPLLVKLDVQTEVNPINQRLARVEIQLQLLPKNIPEALMRLPQILKSAGTDQEKLNAALQASAQLFQEARDQRVNASVDLISETGNAILGTPDIQSISQIRKEAVVAALNYRSFLTSQQAPNTSGVKPVPNPQDFHVLFYAMLIPGVTAAKTTLYFDPRLVSGPEAALLTQIGREYQAPVGPRYFVLEAPGHELALDGQHFRNVIIRDAKIVYKGGPVILENVYFVNCTFDIEKNERGTLLITDILTTPDVTFKTA